MILSRDPGIRKLAIRILLMQAAVTVVFAAISYVGWGVQTGHSALAGGGTGLLANVFMTLSALRPTASAGGALGRLMFGQFMKVAVTVAVFVVAARTGKRYWWPDARGIRRPWWSSGLCGVRHAHAPVKIEGMAPSGTRSRWMMTRCRAPHRTLGLLSHHMTIFGGRGLMDRSDTW